MNTDSTNLNTEEIERRQRVRQANHKRVQSVLTLGRGASAQSVAATGTIRIHGLLHRMQNGRALSPTQWYRLVTNR